MSVPANPDAINPKWLTAVLHEARALDRAQVTSIEIASMGQMGFTGQLRRLRISYDKPEPAAPKSLVAKPYVEVFQMGGVGTSILGRPRHLPRDRRASHHPTSDYTLNCEEPVIAVISTVWTNDPDPSTYSCIAGFATRAYSYARRACAQSQLRCHQ